MKDRTTRVSPCLVNRRRFPCMATLLDFRPLLLVRPNLLSLGFCPLTVSRRPLPWHGLLAVLMMALCFPYSKSCIFVSFFCPIKCPDYIVLALTTNLQRAFFRRISSWKFPFLQSIGCIIVESIRERSAHIRERSAHLREGFHFCFPTGVSRHDG